MSLLNAIQFIPVNQKGNSAQTYQGADDVTNAAQFALIKAGKAGTDGVLDGVLCREGDYGVVKYFDDAGNAMLRRYPDSPYKIDATYGLLDHFGSLGGFRSEFVSKNLGAPALKSNTAVHAAVTLPAADSTTGVHAAVTLTSDQQTITTGITAPSGRLPTITGNASGIVGPVVIEGTDLNGDDASVTLQSSGTSTVKATLLDLPYGLDTITSISFPPKTNASGDTIAVGYGDLVTISSITDPDFAQCVLAKGNASGIAGDAKVLGTDVEGTQILDTIALSGSSAVNGVLAVETVISFALPAKTNSSGDTVSIGTTNILGLPYRMDHDAVYAAQFGLVREATRPTVTYDGTNVSGNTVLLSSALDGAKQVIVDFMRSDAPTALTTE